MQRRLTRNLRSLCAGLRNSIPAVISHLSHEQLLFFLISNVLLTYSTLLQNAITSGY